MSSSRSLYGGLWYQESYSSRRRILGQTHLGFLVSSFQSARCLPNRNLPSVSVKQQNTVVIVYNVLRVSWTTLINNSEEASHDSCWGFVSLWLLERILLVKIKTSFKLCTYTQIYMQFYVVRWNYNSLWCLWRPEKRCCILYNLQMLVSHLVGTGNKTQVQEQLVVSVVMVTNQEATHPWLFLRNVVTRAFL